MQSGAPKAAKLVPPFSGNKESWKVWFARFVAIAEDHDWSQKQKLSILLPKLQGQAGEFVFGVLDKKTQLSFKTLVKELQSQIPAR